MRISKFKRPTDTPAAACGRCFWWEQRTDDGWGRCLVQKTKMYYKCIVCSEYEFEP